MDSRPQARPVTRLSITLAALGLVAAALAVWLATRPDGPARVDPLAIDRLEEGNEIGEALALAERALGDRPDDPELLLRAGRLRFLVGDYDLGEAHLRRLASLARRPADAWLALARCNMEASRIAQAASAAEAALEAQPDLAGARALLARHRLLTNRYEEARDLTSKSVQSGTATPAELLAHGTALLRLGEHRAATEILRRAISASPHASPDDHCALAEALIGSGEMRLAADGLAVLLERVPTWTRAYYLLGTALARSGRRETALPMLRAYDALSRFDPVLKRIDQVERSGLRHRACYERAVLYTETGRVALAIEQCRRGASFRLDDGPLQLAIARHLMSLEATVEASAILERDMQAGVEPVTEILVALAELRLGAGRYDEAARLLERALESAPSHVGALLLRGRVALRRGGGAESAAPWFRAASTAAPGAWEAACWLGRLALERGELDQARTHLTAARRASGGSNAEVLRGLGTLALRTKSPREALRLFLDSLKLEDGVAESFRGLAEGMQAIGEGTRAAQAAENAARLEGLESRLQALRASPTPFARRGEVFLEIAEGYGAAGAQRQRRRFVQLARAADPRSIPALRAVVATAGAAEDIFFALDALRRIIELSPRDSDARRGAALRLARLGVRLDDALELGREAARIDDAPESHYVLGEVLLARREPAAAAREAGVALERDPDDERFRDLWRRVEASENARPDAGSGPADRETDR